MVTLVKFGRNLAEGDAPDELLLDVEERWAGGEREVDLVRERHEPDGLKVHGMLAVGQVVD